MVLRRGVQLQTGRTRRPRAILNATEPMRPQSLLAVLAPTLATLTACGVPDRPQTPGGVTVTDSGDIRLVEIAGEVLDSLPEWALTDEPLLAIGETVGDDPYMFGRVEDALRLTSGEIVIGDGFGFEFRVFGPDGRFIRGFGRLGEGPGEFKSVSLSRLAGGGFAVGDEELRRVTVYDDRAEYVETWPGACRPGDRRSFHDPPLCYFAGLTGEGVVFWYGVRRDGALPGLRHDAVVRFPGGMRMLSAGDGAFVIDSVPRALRASITGVGASGMLREWSVRELFAPEGVWAFGPRLTALGQSDRFEVRLRDSAGTLRRIVRVDKQPGVVTREHLDSVKAWVVDPTTAMSPRDLALQYLDEVTEGGAIPFFSVLRFDNSGRLWISDYVPPPRFVTRHVWRWTILDEDGLPLARAVTGPSGDILEIGEDHVLVREKDEMDAERVAVYGISRTG